MDLISRQAAIDAVEEITWYHQNRNNEMVSGANSELHQAWYKADDIYVALNNVPNAEPRVVSMKLEMDKDWLNKAMEETEWLTLVAEPRKGRWIPQDHNYKHGNVSTCLYFAPVCSECGNSGDFRMNYCPNCGARMEN